MVKKFRKIIWLLLFLIIVVSVINIKTEAAALEKVLLKKVMDNDYKAIIVRANGEMYLLEYGIGVLSLWSYEGKYIHIYSPGLFAGVGSKIMLLEKNSEARIWDSKYIGLESYRYYPITLPSNSTTQKANTPNLISEISEKNK